MTRKAVCLLSGGMDSAVTAAIAKARGFEIYALSFRYRQRHSAELDAAQRVAASLGVTRHIIVDLDLRQFGGSALTDNIDVPKSGPSEGIPVTYVPARNTVFLSIALAWAETLGAGDIFLGVNSLDYSGYPDCRPAYLESFQAMANLATKAGVEGSPIRINAPLLWATKAVIVDAGVKLGVDLGATLSCYDPVGDAACGTCESCRLRAEGFTAAKVRDVTRYVGTPV